MKKSSILCICFFFCRLNSATSQTNLFEENQTLQIQITGDYRTVLDDRGDNPSLHALRLSYRNKDSSEITMPVEIRTRGHFRKSRENCAYPPLLLTFSDKEKLSGTIFRDQKKMKLVMPCKEDSYVIREWLVYKLYNLVTPKSFRARLVHVQLNDPNRKKQPSPFYGFLIEDEKLLAARNHQVVINRKGLRPEEMERNSFLNMAMFEFMIGNTDWSVQYLQNMKLLAADSNKVPVTVPYDFDLAGIVGASYALPAEELQLASVRVRRYRGFCIRDMKIFDDAIALFNKLKTGFYEVYSNCPLLDPKYIKNTTEYLDDFYRTINDPKALKKEFGYPCDPNGTGNVVIKGLAND